MFMMGVDVLMMMRRIRMCDRWIGWNLVVFIFVVMFVLIGIYG